MPVSAQKSLSSAEAIRSHYREQGCPATHTLRKVDVVDSCARLQWRHPSRVPVTIYGAVRPKDDSTCPHVVQVI
uniref:Uncharacterized protein n=1 Tax=Parascaris univalens TaxID=6257 RepID=A0A915A108_PARUN